MIIGAQLYTVRDYCKDLTGLTETLARLKEFGYTSVQISGIGPIPAADVRAACDALGLKIAVTHTSPDRLLNDPLAVIEEHRIYGCDCIGIGAMPEKYRSSEEGVLQFIHDYSEVAKILKDHGMTFHYHNHSFEFEKSGDKTWFDIMIEESDPELFYFILDTFWVQHGGCSPEDYVKRLGKRIKILHLKDFAIQSWKQKFAPIGSGNLNWDAILSNAAEAGIPYAMVEQDSDFADDPISELERSYRFLSAKGFH